MKKLLAITIVCLVSGILGFLSQNGIAAQPVRRAAPQVRRAPAPRPDTELSAALTLAKQGKYDAASIRLFNMTRNPKFLNQRMRIKYILGLMFFEMKMYQVAAFQFVDVIRNSDPRYLKQSLQKLSIAADVLNDDTLLNYAIGKVTIDDFPAENHDMLRYRIGEYNLRKDRPDLAVESLDKVPPQSPFYPKAKYLEALSLIKKNDLEGALHAFNTLLEVRNEAEVTDLDRVAALMGMARVNYQMHKWDVAIDLYRQIPRDTDLWHDALFESSWAHMRSAHFRSVLSNLHSLHSPYYEDFYLPESILLRGIVYLYICQYDEMDKTLSLFEKIYQPVLTKLEDFTRDANDEVVYFNELERVIRNFDTLRADTNARRGYRIPFLVAREIMREGDFKHNYKYINRLRAEENLVNRMPVLWKHAPVGVYARQLLAGRIASSLKITGNLVRTHMNALKQDLTDLFEQHNFARYEMLNGKKEALKKKIQGKGITVAHVDDSKNRDFYIQNGYEYWPFRGEYWLDEIGDYHYLGTRGCE